MDGPGGRLKKGGGTAVPGAFLDADDRRRLALAIATNLAALSEVELFRVLLDASSELLLELATGTALDRLL